ncbi:hypothetical protein [Neisseria sp.]
MNAPNLDQWDKLINIVNNLFSIIVFVAGNLVGAYLQYRHNLKINEIIERNRRKEAKEKSLSEIEYDLFNHMENICSKKDIQLITLAANLIKSRISRFCNEYQISLDDINPPLIDFFIVSSDGRFNSAELNLAIINLKDTLRKLSSDTN